MRGLGAPTVLAEPDAPRSSEVALMAGRADGEVALSGVSPRYVGLDAGQSRRSASHFVGDVLVAVQSQSLVVKTRLNPSCNKEDVC